MNLQVAIIAFIQSSVVLGLALIVCRVWRRNPYARLIVCRSALVAAVAIIIGSPWLHTRPHPTVPVNVYSWNLTLFHPIDGPIPSQPTKPDGKPTPIPAFRPTVAPLDTGMLAESIWLAGIAAAALSLIFGLLRLSSIRGSSILVDRGVLDTVRRVASEFGVQPPEVRTGRAVKTPFVAGVVRPTLYLPAEWDASDPVTFDAICRHEIAHLASQDLRWSLAHRICSGIFWPQPLFGLLSRAASTAGEELSDHRVLSSGCSPKRYADSLITLKESLGRGGSIAPLGIGVVSVKSAFGRRIKSIMETGMIKGSLARSRKAALLFGCVAATIATTMVIAAPSWREGRDVRQSDNPFAPMTGHAAVKILTPDGKPAEGHAELLLDDLNRAEKVVEISIKNGVAEADLSKYPGYYRAILVVQSPGYGASFQRIYPVPSPVSELRLRPATKLVGTAFLPDGKPAGNETLTIADITHLGPADATHPPSLEFLRPFGEIQAAMTTRTDASGRFEIAGLPQGYRARVEFMNSQFARITSSDLQTELSGPESRCKDIHLASGATISGHVTQNGKPVAGIRIGAQQQNDAPPEFEGAWGDSVTDANGYYRITKLTATTYNVYPMLEETPGPATVTAVAHEGVSIRAGEARIGNDFELIPGSIIEGMVTRPDGSPAAGIQVGCYGPAKPRSSAGVQCTLADKSGHYMMHVPAGSQYVYLMVDYGPRHTESRTVDTQDGQTTRVDLQAD